MEMTITKIKDNVQALLTATDSFVTVLPAAPTSDASFAGYPASSHYYSDTQSDFATVSQNRRVIEYIVELYIVGDKSTTEAEKLSEAYALIDSIIHLFDVSMDLSDGDIPLTRACDIMRPSPGELVRVSTSEGEGYMMTVRLYCEADVTFRQDYGN